MEKFKECSNCGNHHLGGCVRKRFDTWETQELIDEMNKLLTELFDDGAGYGGADRLKQITHELKRRNAPEVNWLSLPD